MNDYRYPINYTLEILSQYAKTLSTSHLDILGEAVNNKTYEEIASDLNMPMGTVKSRLHRARKALQKLMRKDNVCN